MLSDVEEINQSFYRYATGKFGTSSGENQIHDISMGDVQYIDGLPMKNHFYFNAYRSLNSEILLDIRIKISKTKIFIKTKTFQTQLRTQSK